MKTIKLSNGEIRHGYTIDDLSKEARNKALAKHIQFIIETMNEDSIYYEAAKEMERQQTPWFLGETLFFDEREAILDEIRANYYLFDEDGELLPVSYYIKDNKVTKTVFGKREIECEIQ